MQAAPTAAQVDSTTGPIEAQLAPFSRHRSFSRLVTGPLCTDPDTRDVGRAIANCAGRLNLLLQHDGEAWGNTRLVGARLCNRRLCPFCEWRRARVWRTRLMQGLEQYLGDEPKRVPLFLTLTVKNCQPDQLRQTVADLHRAWRRVSDSAWFPTTAWMRRTEITASPLFPAVSAQPSGEPGNPVLLPGPVRIGSVHPHLHVLLMVKPSYFGKGYIRQTEWQKQWEMAARLDYPPVVDIRKGYTKAKGSENAPVSSVSLACEAAKYAAKATDLAKFGDALPALHWQLKGLRLIGLSHELRRYIKAADVTEAEMLDFDQSSDQSFPFKLSCVAEWVSSVQEYRIAP